jgi:hypothetical protein
MRESGLGHMLHSPLLRDIGRDVDQHWQLGRRDLYHLSIYLSTYNLEGFPGESIMVLTLSRL